MAALDQAALNLANSLAVNDIPIKLRCTTCNKLAINAFKLPCCDQSICDTCQASLPETCPVCAHFPLDGTSCKQNKSLRLTIKAFLKSEEKKRSKEVVDSQPAPPAGPAQVDANAIVPAAAAETSVAEAVSGAEQTVLNNATTEPPAADEVVDSVEQVSADQALDTNDATGDLTVSVSNPPEGPPIQEGVTAEGLPVENDAEQGAEDINEEEMQKADDGEQNMDTSEQPDADQDGQQQQQQGMQNMMGFNPMMQMPGFGGFNPMMGMMGMNPMNMPFNGFGGMGMNNMSGMNVGMNFGGGFNGWNGRGMGGGNFGGPGPGYYPQGGYNQHQMHQMHNQQFPNRNAFQNRFRGRGGYGRGRGGFAGGRGGYSNQFQNQNFQDGYNQMGNGMSGGSQADEGSYPGQGSAQIEYESQAQSADGQYGGQADLSADFQPGDAADHDDANGTATNGDMTQGDSANDAEQPNAGENDWEHTVSELPNTAASGDVQMTVENDQMNDQDGNAMDDGQTGYIQDQSNFDGQWNNAQDMSQDGWGANNDFNGPGFQDYNQYNLGFGGRGRGRGGFRGGFRGRGGYQNFRNEMQMPAGPPVEPPINAPTGPKAMREGLPNSGKYSRPQINQPSETPAPQSVHQDEQPHSFAIAPSDRGRSPSRAPSERDRKRKTRDRSHSASTADIDKDRRRTHRRRHEEKYSDDHDFDDRSSRRNRSRSAGSSDRRAQRRREKEREKDKYKSSRSHRDNSRRDSRHRRHRSRSPDDDQDRKRSRRDRDRDRDRDYDKEKSRRRSHRSRSRGDDLAKRIETSRRSRHSRDDGPKDKDKDTAGANDDDDIGFKIKGSRSAMKAAPTSGRRESVASKVEVHTTSATDGGAVDIYALEREARHKERVLKEQQRRESATSKGKREFDPPAGPRGKSGKRRGGVFYEDELEDGRGERERW
ncbi:hypothetical protein MBLNU457_g2862t1 [Dothideomycetes sp. NU457]